MQKTVLTLKERLEKIVNQSYDVLCQQITSGRFVVNNEASLQLQFSVILKNIGLLYEFAPNDRFFIELEENIDLDKTTCKSSNGRARCDIWLGLNVNQEKHAECAIELKYFKKSKDETITCNRFSILQDIENLEQYKRQNKDLLCYEIVYTDNPGYSNKNSRSRLAIGDRCENSGIITSNKKSVEIHGKYLFNWDE